MLGTNKSTTKEKDQRVLLIGRGGQLGRALEESLDGYQLIAGGRPEFDVTESDIVNTIRDIRPDIVINTAAWTDVDEAEDHPDECYKVNVLGVQNLALACQGTNAVLVHLSTNEVFGGSYGFFKEWDAVQPTSSVYSSTKASAEWVIQSLLPGRFFIVRTSWMFNHGATNFVSKIVSAARQDGEVKVVVDEFGSPTYAVDLAAAITQLIVTDHFGIYHFINDGYCSRYQFAQVALGLAGLGRTLVHPIPSAEWRRRTSPPLHAVLLNSAGARLGITLKPWELSLKAYFERENATSMVAE